MKIKRLNEFVNLQTNNNVQNESLQKMLIKEKHYDIKLSANDIDDYYGFEEEYEKTQEEDFDLMNWEWTTDLTVSFNSTLQLNDDEKINMIIEAQYDSDRNYDNYSIDITEIDDVLEENEKEDLIELLDGLSEKEIDELIDYDSFYDAFSDTIISEFPVFDSIFVDGIRETLKNDFIKELKRTL